MNTQATQTDIDKAHGEAIGECAGCATDANGNPSHVLTCAFLYTPAGREARTALFG